MKIANPSVAQQRKDRLGRAQERRETRVKWARRFLAERNSVKEGQNGHSEAD